jgi:hypothetical protein
MPSPANLANLLAAGVLMTTAMVPAFATPVSTSEPAPPSAVSATYTSLYPKSRILRVINYQGRGGTARQVVLGGDYGPPVRDDKGMNYLRVLGLEGAATDPVQAQRWEIKEASGPLCMIQPLQDLLKVDDPLKSGDPVVLVPYWVDCDGLDPTAVKLIIYYQDRKYAVRGALPNMEGDEITRYPSANFAELPAALQHYLLDYWAKVIKQARLEHGEPVY